MHSKLRESILKFINNWNQLFHSHIPRHGCRFCLNTPRFMNFSADLCLLIFSSSIWTHETYSACVNRGKSKYISISMRKIIEALRYCSCISTSNLRRIQICNKQTVQNMATSMFLLLQYMYIILYSVPEEKCIKKLDYVGLI